VRFDPVAGFSFAALTLWGRLAVAPGSCEVSDGLLGFEVLERLGYTHKVALDGAMTKAPLGGGKTGPDPTDRPRQRWCQAQPADRSEWHTDRH